MTSTLGIKKIQYPNGTNIATLDSSGSIAFAGASTVAGTLGVTGAVTANAGVVVDNITIDGTEIDLSSGSLTIDVAGALNLDTDAGGIYFKDGGTTIGEFINSSSDFMLKSAVQDKDILFKGNDGGSTITALQLDMSAAGQANFNSNIFTGNTAEFVDGTGTGDKGVQINPIGMVVATRNGGISGIFGRQASDGDIIQLRKSGSAVGSIGVDNTDNLTISGNSSHCGLNFSDNSINPYKNGDYTNGTTDLGHGSTRFKDLFLSGGVYLGGTGTANQLHDYEEGTWSADVRNADNANTFSTEQGYYVKIGKLVHCSFLNDNGNTGGGGGIQIRNLPFTPGGSTNFNAAGIAAVNGGSLTNRQYSININNGNTTANIYNGGTGISGVTFTYISGQFTYYTNS